jgi:ribonucleotide monophosphatase NagD (HAD superfamily)
MYAASRTDDIAGAQAHGLASVYIAGGIDAKIHGLNPNACATTSGPWKLTDEAWDKVVRTSAPGIAPPTFALSYFRW